MRKILVGALMLSTSIMLFGCGSKKDSIDKILEFNADKTEVISAKDRTIEEIEIPSGVKTICKNAFVGCNDLIKVVVANILLFFLLLALI